MANRQIHIANQKERNAFINYKGYTPEKKVLYVDQYGKPTHAQKYVKSTVSESYTTLLKKYKEPNAVAQALVDGDPEININMVGCYLTQASRVYVNEDNKIVFKINEKEFVFNPKGEITDEREPRHLEANANAENPIVWSGKMFPKKEAYTKFVFARKYQLLHTNGLTFDMLYGMAKKLADADALVLVGSGKGTGPVIFQEGGNPFRVFLEGRIKGEEYILLMHLSNLELKPIPQ